MHIENLLRHSMTRLKQAGIETARLDCLVLLEDMLGKDRSWLLAHPEFELSAADLNLLQQQIARREQHEPLAYVRGKVEFYGREFLVDSNVLVPRPESESFIELLKNSKLNKKCTQLLDLGTGSGCIGLTVAAELPQLQVTLADINQTALSVAQKNADKLGLRVTFVLSNLLGSVTECYDIIATNLPYVPDEYPVNRPVAFEPKLALYAGKDGMDLYRKFWSQTQELSKKPQLILAESLLEQHEQQTQLAASAGFKLTETNGLVQLFIR
jgi:release factor glutamine methyltransferase